MPSVEYGWRPLVTQRSKDHHHLLLLVLSSCVWIEEVTPSRYPTLWQSHRIPFLNGEVVLLDTVRSSILSLSLHQILWLVSRQVQFVAHQFLQLSNLFVSNCGLFISCLDEGLLRLRNLSPL